MNEIVLIIHGGAGPDSDLIRKNTEEYKKGLLESLDIGYQILQNGGTALDAVEKAINKMEENPLFNAGRGSALNEKAEVEMDASIMNGKNLKAGAVCLVKNVKHPVSLARQVMEKSKHIYLGGAGAQEFAIKQQLEFMPDAYFITEHAYQQYADARKEEGEALEIKVKSKSVSYGTVGAVALDLNGNLASATSTGGTENKSQGRIGDTSMIGVGTYADNKTCAVSCTGDGEYIIEQVVAYHLASLIKYKELSLKDAGQFLMQKELKNSSGDIGFIAVDTNGNFSIEFNSQRMHRAWRSSSGEEGVKTYRH
jgi:Asparaginase